MITNRHVKKPEGELVLTVLSGTILAILLWVCIVVYDIQTDLKEIHKTLNTMEDTLERHKVLLDNISKPPEACYVGGRQIPCS